MDLLRYILVFLEVIYDVLCPRCISLLPHTVSIMASDFFPKSCDILTQNKLSSTLVYRKLKAAEICLIVIET